MSISRVYVSTRKNNKERLECHGREREKEAGLPRGLARRQSEKGKGTQRLRAIG